MLGKRYISNGMLAAIILSVIIAFMISLIPMQLSTFKQDFPVFHWQKDIHLTEDNLVDFVAAFSIEIPIKKVILEHDMIAVDFSIQDADLNTNVMYKDLFTVIQKSLIQTTNVKEVLLRVFIDDKIFIAVSANREDIKSNPSMELKASMMYKDFLEQYFGLNYGKMFKPE